MGNRLTGDGYFNNDVVVGPTADARAMRLINDHNMWVYGDPRTIKAKEALIRALKVDVYPQQTCIHTYKALKYVKMLGCKRVI